jgi:hypothetical protein
VAGRISDEPARRAARTRRAALGVAAAVTVACLCWPRSAHAGPPYQTDDPEPVEYRHWELYLATQRAVTSDGAIGTAPHVEINYGAAPNLQLHLIAPLAYSRPSGSPAEYGLGDVELGAKFRFVQEGKRIPMIGTFPLLELPAGDEAKGLGTGHPHVFIPLWLQKGLGRWLTYGGGGYWLNPGAGNRNFWYVGWLLQRQLSKHTALGTEVFHTTADHVGGGGNLQFNVGLVLDPASHHHLLFSAGRGLTGESRFQGYFAYQVTI